MGGHDHPTTKPILTPENASVQRFVIPAADFSVIQFYRLNLMKSSMSLHWIEHIDRPSERDYRTNHAFD